MSRRRPKFTPKSKASGKTLKAGPDGLDAIHRRRPRKQDYVAAGIAFAVILALVASAFAPFFF